MIVFGKIYKWIVLNMKIVVYCESNKQMGRACISRISIKPSNPKEELPAPREAPANAGKILVKKRKVKNDCG